jgi:hypothetical protein
MTVVERRVHLLHVFHRARALRRLDLLPADRTIELPQALAKCGQVVGKDGTAKKRGYEECGYRGDDPPCHARTNGVEGPRSHFFFGGYTREWYCSLLWQQETNCKERLQILLFVNCPFVH